MRIFIPEDLCANLHVRVFVGGPDRLLLLLGVCVYERRIKSFVCERNGRVNDLGRVDWSVYNCV